MSVGTPHEHVARHVRPTEAELLALRPELHIPVHRHEVARLGHPRCAFVTGGPREYLPGINCISQRLQALNSSYPLLVMAEPEDEAYMRHHVLINSHPSSAMLTWKRFPDRANRSSGWRYRSAHVLDKMNLFGMPFRRLVWIDADIFLRRNVDDLCELPEDVMLATGLDSEGMPKYCWPARRMCPSGCQKNFSRTQMSTSYVGIRSGDWIPEPKRCPYILQSGVMVVNPFNLTAFNDLVVQPIFQGEVLSYDSGDQGMITTLLYGSRQIFGDAYMRLHPMYNVIARHAKHTELSWGSKDHLTAALMHFTRETRPWQHGPANASALHLRSGEWAAGCGQSLCNTLQAGEATKRHHRLKNTSSLAHHSGTVLLAAHEAWYSRCGVEHDRPDTAVPAVVLPDAPGS